MKMYKEWLLERKELILIGLEIILKQAMPKFTRNKFKFTLESSLEREWECCRMKTYKIRSINNKSINNWG